ncbi:MAG: Mov34/MPN/PAD-1 family protein [Desulfurococcaceae archaeon]
MVKLVIPRRVLDYIISSCKGVTYERVFLGVGYLRDDRVTVNSVIECPNVSDKPTLRFTADPLCVYRVYREAEERGEQVVLLAHSHPAPPYPSLEDVKGMRNSGSLVWLIVSSTSGEHKAWMLENDEPIEVIIEVTD